MRIAYLSTFYPFRGGIAQFNASLYREFEKNHEVKAFTFKRQYPDILFPGQSQFVTENDKPDIIESERVLDTINPFSYTSSAKRIGKYKPDLLLMKFWMPFFAPSLGWTARALKKKGVRVISILDNVIPHERRPGDIALINFYLNQNHGFIVMSDAVKNDLLKLKPEAVYTQHPHPLYDHFGVKKDKIEARKMLNLPENKKILLFFGFIRGYKGLDLLLESVSKLPEDYLLVIAGEVYGKFDEYDEQIKRLGISNKVRKYVRYINDDEVPLFFSAADVCVQPYKSATQSGIAGISYHFDLPMIATNVGGLKEMIEPYGTGIIVDKPDVDLLTNAIQEYFMGEKAEKLKENIKIFKEICSWKNLARAIEELKERITERPVNE
jgi:glycosyltransferase involved in cell wall biosynthesis